MQVHRRAAGIHYHIIRFDKASFLENSYLVENDIVQAFFFVIIESAYAPAKAELINKLLFLGKNVQG